MARYTGPVCRMCRAEQRKLMLKGSRCTSDKCPLNKKRGAPGKDPKARAGKKSEYGIQLAEKQKLRRMYGMLEKQFRLTFDKAARMPGVTGENFIQLLERRLDNVVYRAGFGTSRAQARQLVNHGHFDVNGKKVDIPSYLIKEGDVITVREIKQDSKVIKENIEANKARPIPEWLEKDNEKLQVKVLRLASREDVDIPVEEHLIVELYSK